MTDEPTRARPTAGPLRPRDAAALARFAGVTAVHAYTAHWFHNATFVFPALATIIAGLVWLATGSLEAGGAALFFAIVTLAMLPIVYATWKRTPTAIVVHGAGVTTLHQGRIMQQLEWPAIQAVRRAETMGNVRWYIVADDEEHIVVEGEIADHEALLEAVQRRAGLQDDTAGV